MHPSRVAILAVILLTAVFFRLVGIRFGEPLTVHPDEHNLIYYAMEAGARNGNPGWFEYPSGMIYFSLLIEGLHYLASGAGSPAEFWQSYKDTPFPFHLWLRVGTALFGVLGVVAIWLLGREWDRGKSGVRIRFLAWGGAGLLAVHFLHLRDSHFATVDIPLTTAISLVLWLLLREFHREATTIKRLIPIALGAGICCGIKYTAAPLIFPLLYVGAIHALRDEEAEIGPAWLVGAGAVLIACVGMGFLITTPYAVLDPKTFWSDVGYQWFTSRGHVPVYGGGGTFLIGYIEGPWLWGGGIGLAAFAFFGLMMAALRHEPEDKVLLAFAIPYLVLIALMSRVWGRWFLPLVPIQILWAVRFIGVYAEHPWAVRWVGPKSRRAVAIALIVLMGMESALPALRLLALLRETDTRVEAMAALPEHLSPGEIVLTTPFAAPLPEGVRRETEDQLLRDRDHYESSSVYSPGIASLESLSEKGVSAVLYSSFYWQASDQEFVREAYPGSASYSAFLSDLAAQGDVALELRSASEKLPFHAENIYAPTFDLWRWTRPGPNLLLYLLPDP